MRPLKVLVACEYSGVVRDAFIKAGHDAMSCDLLPTDAPGPHYQGNVWDILDENGGGVSPCDCAPALYLSLQFGGALALQQRRQSKRRALAKHG